MPFIHPNKYYLCNYLADNLDPRLAYSKEEIELFILELVESATFEEPTMTPSHLRREMIERGFLTREPDGSNYRVSEHFVKAGESDEVALARLARFANSSGENAIYRCPWCHEEFKERTFVRHYIRVHTYQRQLERLRHYLKVLE